ncbi:hypothetical protein ACUYED_06740, partial [Salmonella enterica subsp. enterica serovar Paratyphi B]
DKRESLATLMMDASRSLTRLMC